MDILIHYHHNKYLFKCDKNMFNDNIKIVLTKLFSYEENDETQSHIFDAHNKIVRCIICSQIMITVNIKSIDSPFLICDECCNVCINERVIMELSETMLGNVELYLFVQHVDNMCEYNRSSSVSHTSSEHFIKNSHKLIHRFYHTSMIIFMTYILDNNDLNLDVMRYIVQFIY